MLHIFRMAVILIVLASGGVATLVTLIAGDVGGAAIYGGASILVALAVYLFSDSPQQKRHGFEPHRKR